MLGLSQVKRRPFFSSIARICFSTMLLEFRDKTFLTIIALSTCLDNVAVLAGALTSFVFTSLSSSYLGLVEKQYLNEPWGKWVTLGAFVLYELIVLTLYFRSRETSEVLSEVQAPLMDQESDGLESKWANNYVSTLLFVTLSEFGDNTMLGIADLSAKSYSPVPILIGALAAFTMTTLLALFLGKNIAHCLSQKQFYAFTVVLNLAFTVLHATL